MRTYPNVNPVRSIPEPDYKQHTFTTVQGELVRCHVKEQWTPCMPTEKRGVVNGFTQAARLRFLRLIARINWEACKPAVFLTLTYPDLCATTTMKTRTQQRWDWWKKTEKHLDRKIGGLWRIEWKPRKRGLHVGMYAPHLHLLIVRCGFIAKELVGEFWKKAVGYDGPIHTRIDACKNGEHAARYAAKYAAKEFLSGLADDAYLGSHIGRSWGIVRSNLVPLHEQQALVDLDDDQLKRAENVARRILEREVKGSFWVTSRVAEQLFGYVQDGGNFPLDIRPPPRRK